MGFIDITLLLLSYKTVKVCKEDALKRIKDHPFVGLMLDERLNIAVQKKLVQFFNTGPPRLPLIWLAMEKLLLASTIFSIFSC